MSNSPPDLVITTADGTHLAESETLIESGAAAATGAESNKQLYTLSVHSGGSERRSSFAANMLNFAGEVAKKKPKLDEETKQV